MVPSNFKIENQTPSEVNLDLWDAAQKGDLERLKLAIERGGNPDFFNSMEEGAPTSLHAVARTSYKNAACAKELLDNGAEVNVTLKSNFNSPLHEAATNGALEVCRVLINAGATVNSGSGNGFGNTPLHAAARVSAVEVMKLLMENGADVNTVNNRGSTALHFCSFLSKCPCKSEVSEKNNQDKEPDNFLIAAALLIIAGIDVDKPDLNGYTALHIAAQRGSMEMIQLLVDSGASLLCKTKVDDRGRGGRTPAQMAQFAEQTESFNFLTNVESHLKCGSLKVNSEKAKNMISHFSSRRTRLMKPPVGSGAAVARSAKV